MYEDLLQSIRMELSRTGHRTSFRKDYEYGDGHPVILKFTLYCDDLTVTNSVAVSGKNDADAKKDIDKAFASMIMLLCTELADGKNRAVQATNP